MADIIGATTQGVQAVKTLTNVVSASSLSGITSTISETIGGAYDSITHGVTDAIKSISNGNVGNLLNAMTSNNAVLDVKLPLANVLHKYATYTAIFSIGCLDADSFNYPGSSYMAGIMPPMICKSANGDPSNRIKLADGRKYDFFIEDVAISATPSFTKAASNTTTQSFDFVIIEPYSLGMFPQAVQLAAYQQGYSNWQNAAYLLTIEFRGNTENGALVNIPYTKKFFTFNFATINLSATAAGSVYTVHATPSTASALNDSTTNFRTDVSISGQTVQEVLQTGAKSLQQVVNKKFKELVSDGAVKVQDEILILFPESAASDVGAMLVRPGTKENKSSATQDPTLINDANLFKKLGISRSSSSSQLVQNGGTCNGLGRGKIGSSTTRGGTKAFSNDGYNDTTKIFTQSANTTTASDTAFSFSQGSDIINAINQVMLRSDSAVAALSAKQINTAGMRPWWKIDAQVYHIQTNANMKTTGSIPKLYVYRVIPYMVHASKFLPPNAPIPGLHVLKTQIAKVYDYIYTGKNVDVQRFDIEMKNFFQIYAGDAFKRNAGVANTPNNSSGIAQTTTKSASENIPVPQGSTPELGFGATMMKHIQNLTSTDNKGGTTGDDVATRAARAFHDAMLDTQDLVNISCDILGDPYYLTGSGSGNYTSQSTQLFNVNTDGSMDYQNGEVHFVMNFRTPSDINQSTGLYDLKNTQLCQQYSGIYKLTSVLSEFKGGEFRQTLTGQRANGQDSKTLATGKELLTTDQTTQTNTGTAAATPS